MYFLYFGMIAPSRKCLPIVRAVREVCWRTNKLKREVKESVLLFMKRFRQFSREKRCVVEQEGDEQFLKAI